MPGAQPIFIYVLIFLAVLYRVGSRAYLAYSRGYKTWPILAVLGGLYLVLFIIRLAFHVISPVFTIVSVAILLLSVLIFRMSGNSYSTQPVAKPSPWQKSPGAWPPAPAPASTPTETLPPAATAEPARQVAQDATPPWARPQGSPADSAD